jgi:hypothetical protein
MYEFGEFNLRITKDLKQVTAPKSHGLKNHMRESQAS